jgi:hypothetical protein
MRWAGYVAQFGEKRNTYSPLIGETEGSGQLGRPRRRWADSIKMDVVRKEWRAVDWIGLPQDRYRLRGLVNAVTNLLVL